ncbi:hypothetical protein GZ77_12275 [Endozoicomonas montiporae]|uniref:Uncharacterized protein n=2 Tax=Endozoicomonas montiporae TaxID=1027273 RepID=A0A081N443_9GAMM|nr:hypothetical protein [Endozoicomonas montiporae]AMO57948.1 hypothetical protein EZMO1_4011 [Endozoicomonas montiporae CL-33]KEQ13216.1 hypothetical protein GZ77_12275 [Endozoicomonas montiporae]
MKPVLRLAFLIPALSLSLNPIVSADGQISGYVEELDDGTGKLHLKGVGERKVLTVKVDDRGQFVLDLELLCGVINSETGEYVEPVKLPLSLQSKTEEGHVSQPPKSLAVEQSSALEQSAAMDSPMSFGTPAVKGVYPEILIVEKGSLTPITSQQERGFSADDQSVAESVDSKSAGDFSVAVGKNDNQQSPVRAQFTKKNWDLFVKGHEYLKENERYNRLGLTVDGNFIAASEADKKNETAGASESDYSLQNRYPEMIVKKCHTYDPQEVSKLENDLQQKRAEAGFGDVVPPKFDMDINITYHPMLKEKSPVDPDKIIRSIKSFINKHSRKHDQEQLFANLLTYARWHGMGIALHYPDPSLTLDTQQFKGMTILNTKMSPGHAVSDAVQRFLVNVALTKLYSESRQDKNIERGKVLVLKNAQGFADALTDLLPKYKTTFDQILKRPFGVDEVIEGLMLFVMFAEAKNPVKSMQQIYAENGHERQWIMLEAFHELYTSMPANFLQAYMIKKLLQLPIIGDPMSFDPKSKKSETAGPEEIDDDAESSEDDDSMDEGRDEKGRG